MNNTIDNNINEEKWKRIVDFPTYEISNYCCPVKLKRA